MNGWQKIGMTIMAFALVSACTAIYLGASCTWQVGLVVFAWSMTVLTDDSLGFMEDDADYK